MTSLNRLLELATYWARLQHTNVGGYSSELYGQHDAVFEACDHADCTLVRTAALSCRATAVCEGSCNPFVAACGARFCTFEDMIDHEHTVHSKGMSTPGGAVEP